MQLNKLEVSSHSYVVGASKLQEFCHDLFKCTPITFFEPYKIFNNNEYCGLMSDGDWAEYFLNAGYQNSGIAKYQQEYLKSDYTLWSISQMFNIGDCAKNMRSDCIKNDYGNGITLIERYPEHTQLYYFAARTEDACSNEFFINNLGLLNKFIIHFEEQCRQDKFLLQTYLKKYLCQNEIEQVPVTSDAEFTPHFRRIHFHSKTGDFYLTAAEFKCLQLVVYGFTIKQIAKIFNLSYRTIESHLQNAKDKAGCTTLRQLIQKTLYKLKNFLLDPAQNSH